MPRKPLNPPKSTRGMTHAEVRALDERIIDVLKTCSPQETGRALGITTGRVHVAIRRARYSGIDVPPTIRNKPTPNPNAARDKELVVAHQSGASSAQLCKTYKLSRQRVHQIIQKAHMAAVEKTLADMIEKQKQRRNPAKATDPSD